MALATIQTVVSITPIKGADFIEAAKVLGWTVVVKKGDFAVGDRCVFVEIDSILPETEWAEFMRPRHFRVKTARLRGCLSQGLAFPLSILNDTGGTLGVGFDVTAHLGVKKYIKPIPAGSNAIAPFPGNVPKTDELRLQSYPGMLEELPVDGFHATVKLDGTSCTVIRTIDDEFLVCSRNSVMKEGAGWYWTAVNRYPKLRDMPKGFAVQGEVVGPGIQKNRLELEELDFFVFDIYDIREGRYLNGFEHVAFSAEYGVKLVPVIAAPSTTELTLEYFLELARGKYEGTNNRREGIVVRSNLEMRSETLGGSRFSFKVLNNQFLLKDED